MDPAKKAFSLLEEFKGFAFKGNMIDLAIGVIIGAAFGKIIDSLVKNIFMPVVSLLVPGEQGYRDWALTIHGQAIHYGLFIEDVVNFIIVAAPTLFFLGCATILHEPHELGNAVRVSPVAAGKRTSASNRVMVIY